MNGLATCMMPATHCLLPATFCLQATPGRPALVQLTLSFDHQLHSVEERLHCTSFNLGQSRHPIVAPVVGQKTYKMDIQESGETPAQLEKPDPRAQSSPVRYTGRWPFVSMLLINLEQDYGISDAQQQHSS